MIITKLRNIIIYVPTDSFQGHESLLCNMIKCYRPLIFNIHAMENL